MSSVVNPLARIRHLLNALPIDLPGIARELGINIWKSKSLPENVAGKLTRDPKKAGPSGFAIFVRADDTFVRQRFTIAHEIGHFLLHAHLLAEGEEIVDKGEPRKELYRSNLSDSKEQRANSVAAEILMPWNLLRPLINERKAKLEVLFEVSRTMLDIRLDSHVGRRLKRGVPPNPALEAEFKALVEKWRNETEHLSSVKRMIEHPAYERIIRIGSKVLPAV